MAQAYLFGVTAILSGALISLAQSGHQGPTGRGHFPINPLEIIFSALINGSSSL